MNKFGLLDSFLKDDTISEVMVNGLFGIYIERNGKLSLSELRFSDEKEIISIAGNMLASCGKTINPEKPISDARLPDGSRINIILPPLSVSGPMITIRKFSRTLLGAEELVKRSSCSSNMLKFLEFCVKSRQNIIISGGTGSGKTTLLNLLSSFISENERILTIEDTAELQLRQGHVGRLESKSSDPAGNNGVSIRDLVINALRMRPDRIIVGECRGAEALDMITAMNTGHDGSLTSIHSNSPRDCLKRLEIMILMAGFELPVRAIRELVSSAINLIVQTSRTNDGSRKITNISQITGMEGDTITLASIFEMAPNGNFSATGVIPGFIEAQKLKGLGIDMEIFR